MVILPVVKIVPYNGWDWRDSDITPKIQNNAVLVITCGFSDSLTVNIN